MISSTRAVPGASTSVRQAQPQEPAYAAPPAARMDPGERLRLMREELAKTTLRSLPGPSLGAPIIVVQKVSTPSGSSMVRVPWALPAENSTSRESQAAPTTASPAPSRWFGLRLASQPADSQSQPSADRSMDGEPSTTGAAQVPPWHGLTLSGILLCAGSGLLGAGTVQEDWVIAGTGAAVFAAGATVFALVRCSPCGGGMTSQEAATA